VVDNILLALLTFSKFGLGGGRIGPAEETPHKLLKDRLLAAHLRSVPFEIDFLILRKPLLSSLKMESGLKYQEPRTGTKKMASPRPYC
jgi:hypothetical protein